MSLWHQIAVWQTEAAADHCSANINVTIHCVSLWVISVCERKMRKIYIKGVLCHCPGSHFIKGKVGCTTSTFRSQETPTSLHMSCPPRYPSAQSTWIFFHYQLPIQPILPKLISLHTCESVFKKIIITKKKSDFCGHKEFLDSSCFCQARQGGLLCSGVKFGSEMQCYAVFTELCAIPSPHLGAARRNILILEHRIIESQGWKQPARSSNPTVLPLPLLPQALNHIL